jgi:predicted transport protein
MSEKIAQAFANMVKNLEEKTGKSLAEWVKLAQSSGYTKHGAIVAHLKSKHGLGHGYANMVTHEALSGSMTAPAAGGDLVADQYAGEKSALRPLYDKLIAAVQKLGKDVEVSPKKTYVSLRRSKQFAIVQPSTKTRLDVGLNLKGTPAKGRLEASGSFNAMLTHRVRLEKAADIDKELLGWLKQAYEGA